MWSRHIWRLPSDIHLIIFIQSTDLFSIYSAQILCQVLETKIKQIISKSSRSEGQLGRYNTQFGNYIEVYCVIIGEQKRAPNPVASICEEQRKFSRECFLQLCIRCAKSLQPRMHWALFQFSDFQWFPLQDPQIINSSSCPRLPSCIASECALHAVGQALTHILVAGLCLEWLPWRVACCPLSRSQGGI